MAHTAKLGHHRTLIRLAWIIEVIAVTFNFLIAVLSLSQYFKPSDPVPALLAAAPFVLVAFAEFGKIPFTLTMMDCQWYWKPVFFVATVAMASITFLTVSNGLERNFTYQSSAITASRAQIADLEAKLQTIAGRDAALAARRREIVTELDRLDQLEQGEIAAHTERFKLALLKGQNASSKGFIDAIKANYNERRKPLVAERDAVDNQIATRGSADRDTLAARLTEENLTLANAIAENQVYRLAAYVGNKKETEVTPSDASAVAAVVYGAFAMLAAIAGPLLAVASKVSPTTPVRASKVLGRRKKKVSTTERVVKTATTALATMQGVAAALRSKMATVETVASEATAPRNIVFLDAARAVANDR